MNTQKTTQYRKWLKHLTLMLLVAVTFILMEHEVKAQGTTTFRSSTSKNEYIAADIENNALKVSGKTTIKVTELKYVSYYFGNNYSGYTVTTGNAQVKNQSFAFQNYIDEKNKALREGKYAVDILIGTNKTERIWIQVNNQRAVFYTSDCFSIDQTATTFIRQLDKKQLLTSVADDPTEVSGSNMKLTAAQKKAIKDQAVAITKNISADYEKSKAIYNWITANIYYDDAASKLPYGNGNNNPYAVMKNGYAVCEGYSRLMVEMLRSLNIPAIYVTGNAQNYAITSGSGGAHAWLAVYADNRWFYCDPTWDSRNRYEEGKKIKGDASLNYFDKSIQAMAATHRITGMEAKKRIADFDITFYDSHVSAAIYQGNKSAITYPSTFGSLPVTQIVGFNLQYKQNIGYDSKLFNDKVTSITIPSSYTVIDRSGLQFYGNLKKCMVTNKIKTIGDHVFLNSSNTVTIYGPRGSAMQAYAKKNKLKYQVPSSKKSIANVKVTGIKDAVYTGKAIAQPKLAVKLDGKTLRKNTDYSISYQNNKKTGTAKVIITGKNNYTGKITKTFLIKPGKVARTSATNVKTKSMQVAWRKTSDVSGYEVSYSLDKNFKASKTKKITTNKTSVKLSKLTKNKTYYVRIRAFKKDSSGKKIYGSYSVAKKSVIKK